MLQTIVCGPDATLDQTADINPNHLAQAQMFGFRVSPSGRLTGIFIVFNVLPYVNHSGMHISRMGKNKRIMKKFHYFHNIANSEITQTKDQALSLVLHHVQFLSC